MLNYLNDSIVIFALCLIMDCHDSAKAESRNDKVGCNMEYLKCLMIDCLTLFAITQWNRKILSLI